MVALAVLMGSAISAAGEQRTTTAMVVATTALGLAVAALIISLVVPSALGLTVVRVVTPAFVHVLVDHDDRRARVPRPVAQRPRQPVDRVVGEQGGERHRESGLALDRVDQARGEQRMAPDLEEVVEHADAPDPQQVLPDAGEHSLEHVARRDRDACRGPRDVAGLGQRVVVDLAVRVERKRRHPHRRRREHVVGEAPAQVLAQVRGGRPLGVGRDDPRHDPARVAGRSPHQHHRLSHTGKPRERAFDLGELDAVPADLHLAIEAPEEFDGAVRSAARAIPGAVEAGRGIGDEGMGHEALGRELRRSEIAAREPGPSDVDLPGNADGRRLAIAVEDVDLGVRDRPADRDRRALRVLCAHLVPRRERRRLGRAVDVQESPRWSRVQHVADPARLDRLAAEQDLAAARERVGDLSRHRVEKRGREKQRRDAVLAQRRRERARRERRGPVDRNECRAVQQRAPDLERRRVERRIGEVGDDVVRAEAHVVGAAHEPGDGTVRDRYALRRAGRAGRVHHVRDVLRAVDRSRAALGLRVDERRVPVDAQHAEAAGGHSRQQALRREHQRDRRIGEHRAKPLPGKLRVERQVGGPGLEDREHRDDEVGTALEADADAPRGSRPGDDKRTREPVGPRIELPVRERPLRVDHRDRIRPHGRLRLEQSLESRRVRIGRRRAHSVGQAPFALRRALQRQAPDALPRIRRDRREQRPGLDRHAPDRGRIEQRRREVEGAAQDAGRFRQRERQVELHVVAAETVDLLDDEPRQAPGRQRRVVQGERHLEQRMARRRPDRRELLHEPIERKLLVLVRLERLLPDALEQHVETRPVAEIAAHHQHVDEASDQRLEPGRAASGGRHPDRDVLLTRVPVQQDLEGREQRHEQRRPLAPGELLQPARDVGVDLERHAIAPVVRRRRSRPVGRELERAHPRQRPLPVRERLLQRFALQPVALPHRIVGVLHRQLGQRRRLPGVESVVERRKFPPKHERRPSVGDDVVQGQEQPVLVLAQAQQSRPEQRSAREVEACAAFGLRDPPGLRVAHVLRQRAQVFDVERDVEPRRDHLHQPRVLDVEARTQRLVASNDLVQRTTQRVPVERPAKAQHLRLVVDRFPGIQAVEQPQPLLRERRRSRSRGAVPDLPLEIHATNDPVLREPRSRGLAKRSRAPPDVLDEASRTPASRSRRPNRDDCASRLRPRALRHAGYARHTTGRRPWQVRQCIPPCPAPSHYSAAEAASRTRRGASSEAAARDAGSAPRACRCTPATSGNPVSPACDARHPRRRRSARACPPRSRAPRVASPGATIPTRRTARRR